ncbi:MAG: ATP-dependent Clp protease ATP-binding subunit [Candidatus Moranbacteria bacterium]|nr:ATP-dependent Clp protease ATP-binding subunit [Candidatus Moranbacteria bacterium]
MKYIFWYYGIAIQSFFSIGKNYLFHTWDFFSVKDLSRTLFSPWHRDITPKTWRGFDPLKTIRRLLENIFSRIIGAIVRIMVIGMAFLWGLGIVFLGFIFFLFWFFAPGMVVIGGIFSWISVYFTGAFVFGVFTILFSFICFKKSQERLYTDMSLLDLYATSVFDRILARVDLEKNEISRENLLSLEALSSFLEEKNVRLENFMKALEWEISLVDEYKKRSRFWTRENLYKITPIGRQWKYGYTPQLDNVSEDLFRTLSLQFRSMKVCVQEKSLELLVLTLARTDQNSVLIVGNPGSGRKTLIHWLVKRIAEKKLGGLFSDKRILLLNIESVISQSGSDPKRAVNNLEYLFAQAAYAGNVILVINDLEYYVGENAFKNGNPDIGSVLETYLPLGSFRLIATMSSQGFYSYADKGKGMLKSMNRIELDEVSPELSVEVLLDEFSDMEEKNVIFTIKAFRHITEQSGRFNAGVPLPERALDLAKEVLIYWENHPKNEKRIDSRAVNEYITLKTGIPLGNISGREKTDLLELEKNMAERIIGQRQAVSKISKALRKARSGMSDSMRPIGSFLFLGPTGVGKTEMAKVLAKTYFGGDAGMIRLDMSEFQSISSVQQLIGSRELDMPGRLTTLVNDNPYGVLLLDELEKAHQGVLDIFLQIFDEGFFTDAFGTKVRFNNLIIIATSNAGAPRIKKYFENSPQGDVATIEKEVIDEIVEEGIFRVEFLNRFDGVIFFTPLNEQELLRVSEILLQEFGEGLWKNKRIKVLFEEGINTRIVSYGYESPFGARSLKRFIADTVEAVVSERIISEEIEEGGEVYISQEDIQKMVENG